MLERYDKCQVIAKTAPRTHVLRERFVKDREHCCLDLANDDVLFPSSVTRLSRYMRYYVEEKNHLLRHSRKQSG